MSDTATVPKTGFSSILDTNKQELARIEDFKNQKISNMPRLLAFSGLSVVGILVAGFLALQIITGVIALVVTAVACVGGFFGLKWLKHLSPVMKQKMKNKQLELMIEEAQKNAARQLDNQVITNSKRLSTARKSRNKMGAAIEKLKSKVDPAKKGSPMYEKKMDLIKRLEDAYLQVIENLDKGAKANAAFELKVQEYKEMKAFAEVAGEAMAMFEQSGSKQLEDMLSLESFDHIETEFSTALISIENSARDMQVDGE